MTLTVPAIYENGILRPLQPLALGEGTQVQVIVVTTAPGSAAKSPAAILADIAALPLEGPADGFSGRDHDKVMHGQRG